MDALGLLRSVTPKTVESREADAAMMAEDEALEKVDIAVMVAMVEAVTAVA